ncbi:hypothetical protein AKJ09_03076 [Labilithrix luteola]|uniref:DUF2330 domain-containing protein n=1 Tax=Labilithrix luteola TaxID=1391654 RepID=A0A0K1PSB2_9BACT|nr:DUF2330 domain-containing protein [Labilithrix luteola]AKU96412.1 hypothetical protein AKJ09_03076 [Labilithrix luteola]
MRKLALAALAFTAVATTTLAMPRDAEACGGCFAPPETPTVVTDHRMILSISKDQSTLYDQIKYSGAPESFAWVLPISGTVTVGLSSDAVFQTLDGYTQTQVLPPPRNCPSPPNSCSRGGATNASGAAFDESGGGVTVNSRQVVGPYDTVQLSATDPAALANWLSQNGFSVPAGIQPVIDTYVGEHFDFLALKLLPGKGVQDMRPVRVTTPGANAVLPLRMVAAGTGSTVGISLWVVGEGRYEPQNFPTFMVEASELSWDWTQNKSNYVDIRAQKTTAGAGRAWEIENSTNVLPQTIQSAVINGYSYNGSGPYPQTEEDRAQQSYLPITDANGAVVKTAVQVRQEDLDTLFHGIPSAATRVTRLRADVAHAALDADLVMSASQKQDVLATTRQVTKELNQPICPVYNGCDQVGTAPRDEANFRSTTTTGGTTACSTSIPTTGSSNAWLGVGLGAFAVALGKVVRARARRAPPRS